MYCSSDQAADALPGLGMIRFTRRRNSIMEKRVLERTIWASSASASGLMIELAFADMAITWTDAVLISDSSVLSSSLPLARDVIRSRTISLGRERRISRRASGAVGATMQLNPSVLMA